MSIPLHFTRDLEPVAGLLASPMPMSRHEQDWTVSRRRRSLVPCGRSIGLDWVGITQIEVMSVIAAASGAITTTRRLVFNGPRRIAGTAKGRRPAVFRKSVKYSSCEPRSCFRYPNHHQNEPHSIKGQVLGNIAPVRPSSNHRNGPTRLFARRSPKHPRHRYQSKGRHRMDDVRPVQQRVQQREQRREQRRVHYFSAALLVHLPHSQ